MQYKLLMYVHPSFGQFTSSSTTLRESCVRIFTRKKVDENIKINSRSISKTIDGKNIKCWKCGKFDHICKDCCSKATDTHSTSLIVTQDFGSALCTFVHVRYDEWILDSTCFYHICHFKKFFNSYTRSTCNVFIEYDESCKIVAIVSVKIQMFDGIICTLIIVREISSMCKNLISLGGLDLKKFKWSIKSEVLSMMIPIFS